MKRVGIFTALSLLLVALVAVPVLAATDFTNAPSGAHYRNGFSEPVCTLDSATDTVRCTGTKIAGVGNTNAVSNLAVTASADVVCHNPGNKNIVEPHSTTVTDTTSQRLTPSKNGTLVVDPLSETISKSDVKAAFTCPNPNWTEEVTDVTITSYTYTLTFAGFTEPAIEITGP